MSIKTVKPFVDEEFLEMIPRPDKKQYNAIKLSIKEEGQLHPIIINNQGKIIDGHTRFQICQELGIEPKFTVKNFESVEEEKFFAFTTNVKRRHLTPFQMFELVDQHRNYIKQNVKEAGYDYQLERRKQKAGTTPESKRKPYYTNSIIGDLIGVSYDTVERMSRIKKYGNKQMLDDVRSGQLAIRTADRLISNEQFRNNKPKKVKWIPPNKNPPCPACGGITHKVKCHVHKNLCCVRCDYGQ